MGLAIRWLQKGAVLDCKIDHDGLAGFGIEDQPQASPFMQWGNASVAGWSQARRLTLCSMVRASLPVASGPMDAGWEGSESPRAGIRGRVAELIAVENEGRRSIHAHTVVEAGQ